MKSTLLSPGCRSASCTALSWPPVSVIFISSFHVFNVTPTIQSPCLNSRALEKVHSCSVVGSGWEWWGERTLLTQQVSLKTLLPPLTLSNLTLLGGSFCPSDQMLSLGLTEQCSVEDSCVTPLPHNFLLSTLHPTTFLISVLIILLFSHIGLPNKNPRRHIVQARFWAIACVFFYKLPLLPWHDVSFIHANVKNCYSFPLFRTTPS